MWMLYVLLLTVPFHGTLAEASTSKVCLNIPNICRNNEHILQCQTGTVQLLDMRINMVKNKRLGDEAHCCYLDENVDCYSSFKKDASYAASRICTGRQNCTILANFVTMATEKDLEACPNIHENDTHNLHQSSSTILYDCVNESSFINICPSGGEGESSFQGNINTIHLVHKPGNHSGIAQGGINCNCVIKPSNNQDLLKQLVIKTQDVRLQRAADTVCSSAQLTLAGNTNVYTKRCVPSNELYGNFENKVEITSSAAATANVSLEGLSLSGLSDEPEMIWITVKVPDGIQGTVTCYSRNLHDNGSSKVLMQQMKVAFLGRLVNHGGKKERNAVMKEVDNCLFRGLEVVEQFTDCLDSIDNSDFQPLINQSNIDQMPSVPSKQDLSGNENTRDKREIDLVIVIVPVVCGVIVLVVLSIVAIFLYRRRNALCGTKKEDELQYEGVTGDVYSTIPADLRDIHNESNTERIETESRKAGEVKTTNPAYSYSTVIKENGSWYQKVTGKTDYDKLNQKHWDINNTKADLNNIHTYGQASDITGEYNKLNFTTDNNPTSLTEDDYSRCSSNICDDYSRLGNKLQNIDDFHPENYYNHISQIQKSINQSGQERTPNMIQREIISDEDDFKYIKEETNHNNLPPILKRVDSYETPVLKTLSSENKEFPAQDVNAGAAASRSHENLSGICLPVRNVEDSSEDEDSCESDSLDTENDSVSTGNEMNTHETPEDYKRYGQADSEKMEVASKSPKGVDSYETPVMFSDRL